MNADTLFFGVIGFLVVAFIAAILVGSWALGYEVATGEWCNHIGGRYLDSVCLVGDNLKAVRP